MQLWRSFSRPSCRGVNSSFTVRIGLAGGDLAVTASGTAEQVLARAAVGLAGAACDSLVLAPQRADAGGGSFERAARLFARARRHRSGTGIAILQQRLEG